MPTIVSRSGWGARAPRSSIPTTTWSRRTGFAIHHSAGPTGQTVRQIQNHQMDNNGWSDIGYNWLVDQSGKIYEGRSRGWLAIGAHAGGQNTAWIGTCWIGNSGNVAPSQAALSSIKWLYDRANHLAGRRLQVRGHGQVPGQATECPGSRLRAWIANGMPTEEEDVPLTNAEIDKIAERVYDRFTHEAGDHVWAVTNGMMVAGQKVTPHTALRQAWAYGKANYQMNRAQEHPEELAAALAVALEGQVGAPTQEQLTEALKTVLREGVEDLDTES